METLQAFPDPGTVVDHYELTEILGEGGAGRVYAARHITIKKRGAAIKVLSPTAAAQPKLVKRFLREADAVNQIKHPAIVQIFDNGTLPNGLPYLVMERLRGMNLEQYLQTQPNQRLGIDTALLIYEAALEPLEKAHEAGVVHRDLKPDNLFLLDSFLNNPN